MESIGPLPFLAARKRKVPLLVGTTEQVGNSRSCPISSGWGLLFKISCLVWWSVSVKKGIAR